MSLQKGRLKLSKEVADAFQRPFSVDHAAACETLQCVMQAALELRRKLPALVTLKQSSGKPAIQEIARKRWQWPRPDTRFRSDPIKLQHAQREGLGHSRFVGVRFHPEAARIEPEEQVPDVVSQSLDLVVTIRSHAERLPPARAGSHP